MKEGYGRGGNKEKIKVLRYEECGLKKKIWKIDRKFRSISQRNLKRLARIDKLWIILYTVYKCIRKNNTLFYLLRDV